MDTCCPVKFQKQNAQEDFLDFLKIGFYRYFNQFNEFGFHHYILILQLKNPYLLIEIIANKSLNYFIE